MEIKELIGLTEEEAIQKIKTAGLEVRVEARDGEYFMLTQDLRMGRYNLTILGGKVSKAREG